eukprot:TRINITY_DN5719_c0_g1_i2.p1 TRINITY_DN5719_c0_g1~~TRINITY_DN5719_c0_g1_i2.p1  ORF type:complete len:301 (+),score=36.42 TRINITY_DN5719_c0_g1_i2:185-1087(+)
MITEVCQMEIDRVFPEYLGDFCVALENEKIQAGICKHFEWQARLTIKAISEYANKLTPDTSSISIEEKDCKFQEDSQMQQNDCDLIQPIYNKCKKSQLTKCECGMMVNKEVLSEHLEEVCLNRQMKCPNFQDGCDWSGKWNGIGEHLAICSRSLVRCYECGKFMTRSFYFRHNFNHSYAREGFEGLRNFRGISAVKSCKLCGHRFLSYSETLQIRDYCEDHRVAPKTIYQLSTTRFIYKRFIIERSNSPRATIHNVTIWQYLEFRNSDTSNKEQQLNTILTYPEETSYGISLLSIYVYGK